MQMAMNVAQFVQSIIISLAFLVGGIWAIFRYRRLREEKLSIETDFNMQTSSTYTHGMAMVTLNYLIKNAGTRALRLAMEPEGPFNTPFFVRNRGTKYEKPAYRNCELRLWKLNMPNNPSSALVQLRDTSTSIEVPLEGLSGKPINIIEENNVAPNSFWLEPGEIVHFATNFRLAPGYYAGRIQTLFDFASITSTSRNEKKYTFDTFTFAFEVPSTEPSYNAVPSYSTARVLGVTTNGER